MRVFSLGLGETVPSTGTAGGGIRAELVHLAHGEDGASVSS